MKAFKYADAAGAIAQPCGFLIVGGATAVGLRNPNSLTNAMEIFARRLLPPRTGIIPVMHIGEVDCGFVIWWRNQKYGDGVEAQLHASIDAYFAFVDRLLAAGYPSVVVTGATLPTIRDGQDWGEIANLRREVTATLRERTALTLRYNAMLRAQAEQRGLPFIDVAEAMIDPASGVIAERYRHPNPEDHHVDPEAGGKLWAEQLNRLAV